MAEKIAFSPGGIPESLIREELEDSYWSRMLQDRQEIEELYNTYGDGADFKSESNGDSKPADLRYKIIKALLNKEARFLFSKPPDIFIDTPTGDTQEEKERNKQASSVYKEVVDRVLTENGFSLSLMKAVKDCFVGKRVALMYNIDEEKGIQVSFLPSLNFLYDVDPANASILTKIVAFFNLNSETNKANQRIYKKKFTLENGVCYYSETLYNGAGAVVEEVADHVPTRFSFIPAWVIRNDGLTGDLLGVSEVRDLEAHESWYSRMASADLDAERKGMNPIRYTIDASHESTQGLSIAAGAFWDIASDQGQSLDRSAQVGVLDTPMSYASALGVTLDRIKGAMYEQLSVPNVSPEALRGVVTSGKTLKAIYWDLIVRCDEKMLSWGPALQFLARCIIEGIRLYPKAGANYLEGTLPDVPYDVRVDNQYSLPEDEQEEKATDLSEVTAQTMSRKSYMMKWRGLTDEEADAELMQIARERELIEESYMAQEQQGEGPLNQNPEQ